MINHVTWFIIYTKDHRITVKLAVRYRITVKLARAYELVEHISILNQSTTMQHMHMRNMKVNHRHYSAQHVDRKQFCC